MNKKRRSTEKQRAQRTIYIPADMLKEIEAYAEEQGLTFSTAAVVYMGWGMTRPGRRPGKR